VSQIPNQITVPENRKETLRGQPLTLDIFHFHLMLSCPMSRADPKEFVPC
jgi:hypothetical protein